MVIEIKLHFRFASGILGESKGTTKEFIVVVRFLLIKDLDARILIKIQSMLVRQLQINQIDLRM